MLRSGFVRRSKNSLFGMSRVLSSMGIDKWEEGGRAGRRFWDPLSRLSRSFRATIRL